MTGEQTIQTEQFTRALYLWDRYLSRPFIEHLQKAFDTLFPEAYFTLLYIQLHGPCTMTQLAAALRKSKQRTTQIIGRVISQGYAKRTLDPADRRVVRIVLTKKAEAALQAVQDDVSFIEDVRGELSAQDFREFCDALQTVTHFLAKFEDRVSEDTGRLPGKE